MKIFNTISNNTHIFTYHITKTENFELKGCPWKLTMLASLFILTFILNLTNQFLGREAWFAPYVPKTAGRTIIRSSWDDWRRAPSFSCSPAWSKARWGFFFTKFYGSELQRRLLGRLCKGSIIEGEGHWYWIHDFVATFPVNSL